MGWLKSREKRNREMEELGAMMVARPVRRMVARPVTRPVLQKMVARPSAGPQLAPSATPGVLRPTGFYAPAQAPGGYTATGPQAEGQSAATALVDQGIDWSLYAQALSDREKELLDTESESPWVTKRYLSAIERLKRDQFGDNMLEEEQALWNESYVNQFGDSVAPRGVTSLARPVQSEELRLMQDDKERTNRKPYDPSRLLAVTVTAENANDAGLKALYKYQNYTTNRINSIARRKAKSGDSLGAVFPQSTYSRRMLGRLHEELRRGHIVAYPVLTSNKGRRNTYKVHVVRRADSQPFMQRLDKDQKFDWEKPGKWGRFGFDDAQQWAYDKAHGGTRWGPRSMGGGYDTFGASRPSRYVPSERNALWWGRRGMNPPWEEGFGQDVVPHLCETEWGESDARCIQHLGDPYWSGQ
jgi:hypothetical protein